LIKLIIYTIYSFVDFSADATCGAATDYHS